ncbi:MAG: thiamine pyrophosphate-dependent enzyme [Candidatus Pacearchaeota archaeon]
MTTNLKTNNEFTWCPGCSNYMILEAVKKAISSLIQKGEKQENFAIVTGIGCHAKMFDYLNLSGIYGLHGRVLPIAMGITLGNPKLKVIGFAGDGDTYAEGMEHFIHAFRHNQDMTFIVHDNQSFSLTTGQATPTSQIGYKTKSEPLGEFSHPINPIKLALASGATFVARANAMDINRTAEIIEKAMNHKGFSYIEIMQRCLIFNKEMNDLDKLMYKIPDNKDIKKANELSDEFDYNSKKGKIPIGIIFQKEAKSLEDKWPQLKKYPSF